MKAFLQRKSSATYYCGMNYTILVRKDYVEFYRRHKDSGHCLANIQVFKDYVRILIKIGDFADRLERIIGDYDLPKDKYPFLSELISLEKYFLYAKDEGSENVTYIVQEIDIHPNNLFEALADQMIISAVNDALFFTLSLYAELSNSSYPELRSLADCFYD